MVRIVKSTSTRLIFIGGSSFSVPEDFSYTESSGLFTINRPLTGISEITDLHFSKFEGLDSLGNVITFSTVQELKDYLDLIFVEEGYATKAQGDLIESSPRQFIESFSGISYVRKNKWYGFHPTAGINYHYMNYKYGNVSPQENPVISFPKYSGAVALKDCKLVKVSISFNYSNKDIQNLYISIQKISVGNSSISTGTIYQGSLGNIGKNKNYSFYFDLSESVTIQDCISVYFNKENSGDANLYNCNIKFIFE